MPKWKDRECARCKEVSWTASKADYCQLCQMANKRDLILIRERKDIVEWGFTYIDGPIVDKFNHRLYKLLTPCNHVWEVPYNNLLKQIKHAKAKGTPAPCQICGGKRRMNTALVGYVEKHGRDYDLEMFEDYRKKVRGLTEVTYRQFKNAINPLNFKRGLNSDYHLDHIVPIIECFKRGWSPADAASKENLQMLTWTENLMKGSSPENL